jgi:hypothetical protein
MLTQPSCDSDYGSSQAALHVPDATISWSFKHYADCTNRALWIVIDKIPHRNFNFYVGVGVPTLDRFATVRVVAVVIGPGLPRLSAGAEFNSLPQEIREDPVWNNTTIGAYIRTSPADQSTCNHLGSVMSSVSTIRNGRCNFYEPHGQTNSWRVLDADNNILPVADATYHVAVYVQEDVSAKFSVALGTFDEDFATPFTIDTPTCTRDLSDFSEKLGAQDDCFPVVACPENRTTSVVGCE